MALTQTDRAVALASLANARDYLALLFEIISQITQELGGVPRPLLDLYNKTAAQLEQSETQAITSMRKALAKMPGGTDLLSILPTDATVPRLVIPAGGVLGHGWGAAPGTKAIAEAVERGIAKGLEAKAAAAAGRAFNWRGIGFFAGGAAVGLLALDMMTKGQQADYLRAELDAQIAVRAGAHYDTILSEYKASGAPVSNCLDLANKAMGQFITQANRARPTNIDPLTALGYVVAGSAVLFVGWRVSLRYKNGEWPFEKKYRGSVHYIPPTARGRSSRSRHDDDDDEDLIEA